MKQMQFVRLCVETKLCYAQKLHLCTGVMRLRCRRLSILLHMTVLIMFSSWALFSLVVIIFIKL